MRTSAEHKLAYQIRTLREAHNLTQGQLAKKLKRKSASSVARLEDPTYGRYSLSTLVDLANTFDVGLLVKFVPFSKLLLDNEKTSPKDLQVEPFESELPNLVERSNGKNISPFVLITTMHRGKQPQTIIKNTAESASTTYIVDFNSGHQNGKIQIN